MDELATQSEDLVSRILAGDRRAEEALVRRYAPGVMFLLRQRTRDADVAHDLHQDTFQVVLLKLRDGELREPERLRSFIASIANNLLIDHYRREHRRNTHPDSEMIERASRDSDGPFESLERAELRAYARRIVDDLKVPRDQQLIRRYFFEQASKAELCRELDLPPQHFDRVKYRAIRRLIELVKSQRRRHS